MSISIFFFSGRPGTFWHQVFVVQFLELCRVQAGHQDQTKAIIQSITQLVRNRVVLLHHFSFFLILIPCHVMMT
jgi:hypothetical protein